jgi:hypothetical protein
MWTKEKFLSESLKEIQNQGVKVFPCLDQSNWELIKNFDYFSQICKEKGWNVEIRRTTVTLSDETLRKYLIDYFIVGIAIDTNENIQKLFRSKDWCLVKK